MGNWILLRLSTDIFILPSLYLAFNTAAHQVQLDEAQMKYRSGWLHIACFNQTKGKDQRGPIKEAKYIP